MPIIAPFRGLRPGPGPFDVDAQTWLLRLPTHGDDRPRSPGLRVRDTRPAFYRYEVTWGPPESRRHATAFLARLALEESRGDAAAAVARDAAESDAQPVVYRYVDERGWVDEILQSNAFDELVRATDRDGAEHRIARVERAEGVEEVVAQFEDRVLRLESGADLLAAALARWRSTKAETAASVLVLLAPEGPPPAPWRAGFVLSPADEPRPRHWTERAGDPGKAKWRTPSLG